MLTLHCRTSIHKTARRKVGHDSLALVKIVFTYYFFETACSLQSCLNTNTYNPEKCDARLIELYKCCMHMYERAKSAGAPDAEAKSTACPKREVVDRILKRKLKS